jgi:hypothetical protein
MRYVELREMAYTRQIAISIMVGVETPINDHLIKLFVLQVGDEARHHWVHEIGGWYDRITDIRLEPRNTIPPYNLFWDCLFANRFTPDGERPIQRVMGRLSQQYVQTPEIAPAAVLERMTEFHQQCCTLLSQGQSPDNLILALK